MLATITKEKKKFSHAPTAAWSTPEPPLSSTLRETLRASGLAGRYAGYTAQFRVEEFKPNHWWILDRDVKVGMIHGDWHEAELTNFDPHQPDRAVVFPETYHAPTQPGDRVTLAKWLDYGQATTSDRNEISFQCNGHTATATMREEWNNGRTAYKRATWKVDSDFGYILQCEDGMRSRQPEVPDRCQEYANFLARGVTDNRRESGARYPYVLWQHPNGDVVRWNQNNISARALGAMDLKERRRIKTGGFIGYFGEADRNVALEILESSPESTAITCPNMLDEHIMWNALNVEEAPRAASGEYSYRAVYNLVSVPPEISHALTQRAQPLDLVLDRVDTELEKTYAVQMRDYPQAPGAPYPLRFYPLEMNVVCDFETPLDPASSFRGQVFPYLEDVDEPISTVSDCGHSGTHSLRLRADGESVQAKALGCSLHVTEGKCYRLSAWIKTELSEGEVTLRAVEYQFSPVNTTAIHNASVTDENDWQRVAVEWTPGEKAHVVDVCIEVIGRGIAWVDDILIEELT